MHLQEIKEEEIWFTLCIRPSSITELLNFLNNSSNASTSLTVTAISPAPTNTQRQKLIPITISSWQSGKEQNIQRELLAILRRSSMVYWSFLGGRWWSKQAVKLNTTACIIPIKGINTAQILSLISKELELLSIHRYIYIYTHAKRALHLIRNWISLYH